MTAEPRCWGGVSHPSQLTTGLVIKSVTTSPTLAGERMLFILQVSILSEQINKYTHNQINKYKANSPVLTHGLSIVLVLLFPKLIFPNVLLKLPKRHNGSLVHMNK